MTPEEIQTKELAMLAELMAKYPDFANPPKVATFYPEGGSIKVADDGPTPLVTAAAAYCPNCGIRHKVSYGPKALRDSVEWYTGGWLVTTLTDLPPPELLTGSCTCKIAKDRP